MGVIEVKESDRAGSVTDNSRENSELYTAEHYRRLEALINSAKLGMVIIDQSHRAIHSNQRFADMLGYTIEEVLELYTWDWEVITPREEIEADFSDLAKIDFTIETKHRRKDGSTFDVEVNGTGINFGSSPDDNAILCFCQDISARKEAERLLIESERKFKSFVENAADMIFTVNIYGHVDYISPNCERVLGYPPENLMGPKLLEHFETDDRFMFLRDIKMAFDGDFRTSYEYRIYNGERRLQWYSFKLSEIETTSGQPLMICNARNITEKKEYEKILEYVSMHDQLTGVYNRVYFNEEIKRRDEQNAYPLSVIIFDLDDFKSVNDNWGHAVGDRVLVECTKIVGLNLRKDDVLARTGGDEFSILLPATSEKDAGVLAERITRNIEKHNEKSGLPPIKMSLGIASKENTSTPIETILRIADDNMYMEKKEKKRLREAGELE
jgi:diguanylate cyclase (GGDEF)-like protein/PAS domain S-box-containing protein